jgi:hypothetical protein
MVLKLTWYFLHSLVLTIQATGANTSNVSLAIDYSIEPSTAVKS